MTAPRILALDLASRTGWACGFPDEDKPRSGSVRFTREGASLGAVFAGCRQWLSDFVATETDIGLIVFEAPMAPAHMAGFTSAHVIRVLIGLCAVVEEFGYARGYDVREARKLARGKNFVEQPHTRHPPAAHLQDFPEQSAATVPVAAFEIGAGVQPSACGVTAEFAVNGFGLPVSAKAGIKSPRQFSDQFVSFRNRGPRCQTSLARRDTQGLGKLDQIVQRERGGIEPQWRGHGDARRRLALIGEKAGPCFPATLASGRVGSACSLPDISRVVVVSVLWDVVVVSVLQECRSRYGFRTEF
jgi:hypothetical protein